MATEAAIGEVVVGLAFSTSAALPSLVGIDAGIGGKVGKLKLAITGAAGLEAMAVSTLFGADFGGAVIVSTLATGTSAIFAGVVLAEAGRGSVMLAGLPMLSPGGLPAASTTPAATTAAADLAGAGAVLASSRSSSSSAWACAVSGVELPAAFSS